MNAEIFDAVLSRAAIILGALSGWILFIIEIRHRYRFEKFKKELEKDLENHKNELEKRLEEFKKDLEIKYELRIKTHQEAFAWLMDLNVALTSDNEDKMHEVAEQARDWWDKNCFFLDGISRGKFVTLTNMAHMYARDVGKTWDPDARQIHSKIWELLQEAIESVQDGIKIERLDVFEKPKEKEGD